jgi:hypothetical protein
MTALQATKLLLHAATVIITTATAEINQNTSKPYTVHAKWPKTTKNGSISFLQN